MTRTTRVGLFFLLALLLGTLRWATPGHAQGGPITTRAVGPKGAMEATLRADGAPLPGGIATLTFDAIPTAGAASLEVRWHVPAGAELVGDPTESFSSLAAGQAARSERRIRFPTAGTYKVTVDALTRPAPGYQFAASAVLFFTIRPQGSTVSDRDPAPPLPTHRTIVADTSAQHPDVVPQATEDGCFQIRGRVMRTDRPPTPNGTGAAVQVPVRGADIEVREEDTFSDDSYGHVVTDQDGYYSLDFCDDDGFLNDELEIYVRMTSHVNFQGNFLAKVTERDRDIYSQETGTQDSEGGRLDFNITLDEDWSGIFNILDGILDAAAAFRSNGALTPPSVNVLWQPRGTFTGSNCCNAQDEMNIAEAAADSDQWDDAVIMHEYAHLLDNKFSCNQNPGGPHGIASNIVTPTLAFGEGFPDYWQSVPRVARGDPFGQWYIDTSSPTAAFAVDLEQRNYQDTTPSNFPIPANVQIETAIAAALWDLTDASPTFDEPGSATVPSDTVGYGANTIQDVFTGATFRGSACTWNAFESAWKADGKPSNAGSAAAVTRNVGSTTLNTVVAANAASQGIDEDAGGSAGGAMSIAAASASVSPQDDGDWWEQIVFAVDNSKSMEGAELEAVKTVLKEQVHDLATENPEGVEMRLDTFDETGNNRTAFANQFFPEAVVPIINGLAPSAAADPGCAVNSLAALTRAIGNRSRLDAWLFTDGTPYVLPGAETMRQFLADRSARVSIALLGNCPVVTAQAVSAVPPLGLARAYLGLAADETPGGIVPYLITAIASGGQFLYGTSDNAQDLADILRAQISHSAGAGRWSDYVSDVYTYRHDRLASWEYQDIDATTGYDAVVDPAGDGTESIALPQGFTFYGSSEPATSVEVYQNGYVTLQASPNFVGDADWTENRPVPDPSPPLDAPSWPHRALYAYWDDLEVSPGPRSAMDVQAPQADFFGAVFGKRAGDWYVIQYEGFKVYQLASQNLDFQILLNLRNGEIRYQYLDVPNEGAASATIGLEGNSGFGFGQGVQVSYNDITGAVDRTGYKFTPAPPQPTKTYSVTVDSSMRGIAFLLTGYSGSFEPLVVRDPSGTQVACDAAGVLCLNLGLVQYVQANVNDRVGTWTATVDAGPTGSGTFSFTSFGASALAVRSSGDHSLSSIDASRPILVDLGRTVNGNEITGWFTEPNGAIFNGDFPLYDDGAHGDGAARDGLFGSFPFGPGRAGTAYLWVRKMRGEEEQFRRVDPVPYTFQPLRVTLAPSEVPNYGYYSDFTLTIENHDSVNHCYNLTWQTSFFIEGLPSPICVAAGTSSVQTFSVSMNFLGPRAAANPAAPTQSPNGFPSGTAGTVTVTATEAEQGIMSDSASAIITRRRPPAQIAVGTESSFLRPNGDTTPVRGFVLDEQNTAVADGIPVTLTASTGVVSPTVVTTHGGVFAADYISGPDRGIAVISAEVGSGLVATTTVEIGPARAIEITLEVSPEALPVEEDTAELRATVRNRYGEPVGGQTVRLIVEGDGGEGTIEGGEVFTATTSANGRVTATYTRGTEDDEVEAAIRAELLAPAGGDFRVVDDDRKLIRLTAAPGQQLFLPMVGRR